jgi:DNA-directed RNA polymerase specialized sigma24 family protein
VPLPEEVLFDLPEQAKRKRQRLTLALKAWDKLTDVQQRRYRMYHVEGLTEEKIAAKEGSTQQAVSKSLHWAEKKIKKFLTAGKK